LRSGSAIVPAGSSESGWSLGSRPNAETVNAPVFSGVRSRRRDVQAPLGGWRRHRETCEARILEVSGPEFERGRAKGRSMTLDDAVGLALR
jgi:hypothetical protein